jgi:hypothetical protein
MAIDHSTHQEHLGAMRGEHLEGHIVREVYFVLSTWLLDPGIICRLIQLLLDGERFHPTWSKLGQGGERFLPQHSTSDLFSSKSLCGCRAYCWRVSAELGHTNLERVAQFAQR